MAKKSMAGRDVVIREGRKLLKADSAQPRVDGMANLFTAMGTSLDRSRFTRYVAERQIDWKTLENMYEGDGLARRLIDLPTKEMTYRGYEIEGDTDGELYRMMEERGFNEAVRELYRWSRLYGGALAVILIDDGSDDLAKPLNPNRIESVDSARVWNRWRTWWSLTDAYNDPMSKKYMTPSKYKVIPIFGGQFTVHESRTIRMDGVPVSDRKRLQNLGWGDSFLQSIWEQMRQMATVYNGTERIVDGFLQEVMSIKNLANMLQTDEGTIAVQKRLKIMDLTAGNFRRTLLDADMETYTKHSSTVTGLRELMDSFGQLLCAVTGMPSTKLFGSGPPGLAAQGAGDTEERAWYDDLAAVQTEKLAPAYTRFLNLIIASREYNGPVKANPKIIFRPLWQMNEKEQAEMRYKTAQTDRLYAEMGLTAKEIIASRFGGGHYSTETNLDATVAERVMSLQKALNGGDDGDEPPEDDDKKPAKAPKPGAKK